MTAQCIIAGRVAEKPYIKTVSGGRDECWMIVESEKPFSTIDRIRLNDRFRIQLWRGIAEECAAMCRIGSVVIVGGRLESEGDANDGEIRIIAETVSRIRESDSANNS